MKTTHTTQAGTTLEIKGVELLGPKGRLALLDEPEAPNKFFSERLRKAGKNPAEYRILGGHAFDLETADWIAEHVREQHRAAAEIAAQPMNRDHAEVDRLFAQAEKLRDYPGEYFPAMSRAKAALQSWREKYPEAAKEERRHELLAEAEHQESLASGALIYDADGWLSREDQDKRAAEFRANAKILREQVKSL